jgi:hypothetical protein
MNFRKLPKEKRQQFILVTLVTLVALGGLGFGLIRYQYAHLTRLADNKADAEIKLKQMRDYIKQAGKVDAELAEARKVMTDSESDLASGDLYSWVMTAIRGFKAGYKVDITQITPNGPMTDVNLLPKFPYKQGSFTVTGSAYYHDFGRFLADFENEFPHVRMLNLDVRLNPSPSAGEKEKLAFKMDIMTLVKPNPL